MPRQILAFLTSFFVLIGITNEPMYFSIAVILGFWTLDVIINNLDNQ